MIIVQWPPGERVSRRLGTGRRCGARRPIRYGASLTTWWVGLVLSFRLLCLLLLRLVDGRDAGVSNCNAKDQVVGNGTAGGRKTRGEQRGRQVWRRTILAVQYEFYFVLLSGGGHRAGVGLWHDGLLLSTSC